MPSSIALMPKISLFSLFSPHASLSYRARKNTNPRRETQRLGFQRSKMEKGAQKRKATMKRRRRSRGLAKAVADYLLSDSYMYAPLIDSPPSVSGADPDPDPLTPSTRVRASVSNAGMPVAQLQRLLAK